MQTRCIALYLRVLCFRRQLFLGFTSSITIATITPFEAALANDESVIRVFLGKTSEAYFRSDNSKKISVRGLSSSRQKISKLKIVRKEGNTQFYINGSKSKNAKLTSKDYIRINSRNPRGIWFANRRYRGELRAYIRSNSIEVVNHVGITNYLASVVGGEMPKNWPLSALKAQAVAARTYAFKKRNQKKNLWYDITSNENSQVYLGAESETFTTSKAVRDTRSLVLKNKGDLINAVFHSCSGGMTERSGAVWKYQLPYLVSVPDFDQSCPNYQWNIRFGQKKLKTIFPEINGLTDFQLLNVSNTGRVLKAKLSGPRGELILSGKDIRRRLKLKSTLFRFKFVAYNPFLNQFLSSLNSSVHINGEKNHPSLIMRKSFGFWRDWSLGGENYISDKLPFVIPPSDPSNSTSILSVETSNKSFQLDDLPPLPPKRIKNPTLIVSGFGAGHGVGMSQWGVYKMAIEGAKFREILKHYYPKVKIIKYR